MIHSKRTVAWFGSELDKLPQSVGKALFQHFYLQDKGENIYELTDPVIQQAFFYCRENENKSLLQTAVKICINLNKHLIIITRDCKNTIVKQYSVDNINITVISFDDLKHKDVLHQILTLFHLPDLPTKGSLSGTHTRGETGKTGKVVHTGTLTTSINEVVEYIEHNLNESLSINDFAYNMNYSVSYFSKQFHALTGISFQDFIINKRVELAKTLLHKPETITSVAYQCGFKDPSYFSRLFKKRTGMTPVEYKYRAGGGEGREGR